MQYIHIMCIRITSLILCILITVITFECLLMCTCTGMFAAVTQHSELHAASLPLTCSQLLYSVVSDHTRKTHVESMPCGCIHGSYGWQAMHRIMWLYLAVVTYSSSWFALSFKMQKMRISSEIYLSEKFTSKLQWVIFTHGTVRSKMKGAWYSKPLDALQNDPAASAHIVKLEHNLQELSLWSRQSDRIKSVAIFTLLQQLLTSAITIFYCKNSPSCKRALQM